MNSQSLLRVGYWVNSLLPGYSLGNFSAFLANKKVIYGQILLALADYVVIYTKKYSGVSILTTYERSIFSSNGTILGVEGLLIRGKVDIGFPAMIMDDHGMEMMDFSYPFELGSLSFFTPKPKYKSRISGIFETFSKPLWLTILINIVVLIAAHYFIMKQKHSLDKFFLHVFALAVKQGAILKPSLVAEKLLIYSWVFGAMVLCFAFDSVFLGFLAFPPLVEINNLQELATAVSKGQYRAFSNSYKSLPEMMKFSKDKNLIIVADDILRNTEDYNFLLNFYKGKIQNYAIVMQTDNIALFSEGYLISEDRFLHYMSAIPLKKGFCCKKLLERFVHKLVESGIYQKYRSHSTFLGKLPGLLRTSGKSSTLNRKLNLIDVAAAFIVLLTGYFISFLVLIGEIWSNHKKKVNGITKNKRRNNRRIPVEDSV